jgi:hypothetical protein
MKNNLIIILSHCDSREKSEILIDNIKKLKTQNFDVLLLSHIPIPSSIQQIVEYFIYDKSNPIINWPDRGMVFWKKILGNTNYRLQTIYPDLVHSTGNEQDTLSVDYNGFITLLISGIKELKVIVDAQQTEIDILKNK